MVQLFDFLLFTNWRISFVYFVSSALFKICLTTKWTYDCALFNMFRRTLEFRLSLVLCFGDHHFSNLDLHKIESFN